MDQTTLEKMEEELEGLSFENLLDRFEKDAEEVYKFYLRYSKPNNLFRLLNMKAILYKKYDEDCRKMYDDGIQRGMDEYSQDEIQC